MNHSKDDLTAGPDWNEVRQDEIAGRLKESEV